MFILKKVYYTAGCPIFLFTEFGNPILVSEKATTTHSSTLAWKIPWTEGPGRLQSMGSLGVRHDWATSLSLFTFMHWRRKWQPTPVFLPGEFQGRGAWWAAVYGVAQSRTWLKRLSSSSSSILVLVSTTTTAPIGHWFFSGILFKTKNFIISKCQIDPKMGYKGIVNKIR